MAGVVQEQPSLLVSNSPAQLHGHAVVVFGKAGFGELQFQLGERFGGRENLIRMLADAARHLEENAMNLGEFIVEQPYQFVVLVDGFERLNKYGLAAGTRSVNHALHAAFLLDLYRNHEALTAYRD